MVENVPVKIKGRNCIGKKKSLAEVVVMSLGILANKDSSKNIHKQFNGW